MAKKSHTSSTPTVVQITVKLTARRKARYDRAAEIADLSLSEWIRRVLDPAADELIEKHDGANRQEGA